MFFVFLIFLINTSDAVLYFFDEKLSFVIVLLPFFLFFKIVFYSGFSTFKDVLSHSAVQHFLTCGSVSHALKPVSVGGDELIK